MIATYILLFIVGLLCGIAIFLFCERDSDSIKILENRVALLEYKNVGIRGSLNALEKAEQSRKDREGISLTHNINYNPFANIHVPGFSDKDD